MRDLFHNSTRLLVTTTLIGVYMSKLESKAIIWDRFDETWRFFDKSYSKSIVIYIYTQSYPILVFVLHMAFFDQRVSYVIIVSHDTCISKLSYLMVVYPFPFLSLGPFQYGDCKVIRARRCPSFKALASLFHETLSNAFSNSTRRHISGIRVIYVSCNMSYSNLRFSLINPPLMKTFWSSSIISCRCCLIIHRDTFRLARKSTVYANMFSEQ